MKFLLSFIFFISFKAFSAGLPYGILGLSTWNGVAPDQKKIFNVYALRQSNSRFVVTFNSGPTSEPSAYIDPKTSYVVTDKELETLNELIPQYITESAKFDMILLQGLEKNGKFKESSVDFNGALQIVTARGPMSNYVGSKYSPAAYQTIQLIMNVVNDKKHQTLENALKKSDL